MIVGREKETNELLSALHSSRPEFVVVYGRRRVGKTYLIDTVYRDNIVFRHTGLPPIKATPKKKLQRQLASFAMSLAQKEVDVSPSMLENWSNAFLALEKYLDSLPKDRRAVIFLDELPWMDTTSSGFLDIELRGMNGLDLCKRLLQESPHTNVVFLTAFGDYSLDAWDTGACGFMLKPITVEGVKKQLKNLRYPFYSGKGNP